MSFAVGSLVKARGREWVVLPESKESLLVLRPLGGTEEETTGIYLPLEPVESAQFDLPNPTDLGDHRSCRLLRDAVRLGFRSSAGPFRSFGKLAVEPRPYQLVPLLMAMKLDPIRILIADDVGIGKTIEACLIARELIDRGEIKNLAILCPPHLAEQWQKELLEKFHIDAELVLPSTVSRLERNCRIGQSLFEIYPHVIVSTDFIKADRRRDEFLRACPEMVIVDEAHACVSTGEGRGSQHQRHQLVSGLAADGDRHLILVTATPHSGKEEAFRSLLSLLNPEFSNLPQDLTGKENEHNRRRLAGYFVQRRRGDIRHYLKEETPFPEREELEETYSLSEEYKNLFRRVLNYARETVTDPKDDRRGFRVRWWSALALLRSLASSPAAAAATLRSRAPGLDTETVEEVEEVSKRTVLDLSDVESTEATDLPPGSDFSPIAEDEQKCRRRLLELAREADSLNGTKDKKLQKVISLVKSLLKDNYRPILFCKFIPTAEYVADQLRNHLPKDVDIIAVTGLLPPAERESRVLDLAKNPRHVLVCTDCLSEGVNLQEHFDAVLHYDLSWNPTRHEQREGRVDRYGQLTSKVRVLTCYGIDNQIDGIVLDVLITKHKKIRSSLGISVPVPVDTDQVIEAIFEGLLLRERTGGAQQYLPGFEEYLKPQKEDLFKKWDTASEREKRSRTMFAQETIKVEEVARELKTTQLAIGSNVDVSCFTKEAFEASGGVITENGFTNFDLREVPRALRERVGINNEFKACFNLPHKEGEIYLNRTHPIVEGVASFMMDLALDPLETGVAKRCGVIRTNSVGKRTTLLLLRLRYHILTKRNTKTGRTIATPLLAEDSQIVGFSGSPQNAQWLDEKDVQVLLQSEPQQNISADQASDFIQRIVDDFEVILPHLEQKAKDKGEELLDAHRRVRVAMRTKGLTHRIEPQLPPDVLGIYVLLPLN